MRCAYSWAARPAANGCQAKGGLPVTDRRGGDIACAVRTPDAVRLLIGDVMGHDRHAARTAAAVSRAFRRLAAGPGPIQDVAAQLDAYVARRGAKERFGRAQFVTAQLVSVPHHGGEAQIVCCGHPSPLLLSGAALPGAQSPATLLDALPPSPPLGLLDLGGYPPRADLLGARPGDSVLLYTDGVSEACDSHGEPYPLAERAVALCAPSGNAALRADGSDELCLPGLLDDVVSHVGGELRDDATLLYLRFAAADRTEGPSAAVSRPPALHC
jgi:serine phosphatase RsbU (regulator of sigma subunit)